jgi:hypothetical protein
MAASDSISSLQLNAFVALQYFSATLFSLQLAMVLYNSYVFVYRQGRYKILPLVLFYVLTFGLTCLRIYFAIWFFNERNYQNLLVPIMTPVIKIDMGLVQCWMLFELALRVQ